MLRGWEFILFALERVIHYKHESYMLVHSYNCAIIPEDLFSLLYYSVHMTMSNINAFMEVLVCLGEKEFEDPIIRHDWYHLKM